MKFILVFSVLWCCPVAGFSQPHDSAAAVKTPSLLILEPVDLSDGKTSKIMGEKLRGLFAETGRWQVFSRQETAAKLKEYSIDISRPCKEYSCAFDAGNMFHAGYVLFSTISRLSRLYAFNLAIIDVQASRVVWAHTGDIPIKGGGSPDDALIFRLKSLIAEIASAKFKNQSEASSKGVLGIIDYSQASRSSILIEERLATHVYGSGLFELMGQSELEYLRKDMNISPSDDSFTPQNMQETGGKLGLDFLIYSRLNRLNSYYHLRLALYDVQNRQLIRDWPIKSKDFRRVLEFENKFSASLSKTKAEFQKDAGPPFMSNWRWVASPLAGAAGLLFSYMAVRSHLDANTQFDHYQNANTLQELERRPEYKSETERLDSNRNIYLVLSALSAAGCVLVWYF